MNLLLLCTLFLFSPVIGRSESDTAGLQGMVTGEEGLYGEEIPKPEGIFSEMPRTVFWEAWRGERVSAKILLWSDRDLDSLSPDPSTLFLYDAQGDSIPIRCVFLRCVTVDSLRYADQIDFPSAVSLKKNIGCPLWLSAEIPTRTTPGVYTGTLAFFSTPAHSDPALSRFPIRLELSGHVLPPPDEWHFELDLPLEPEKVATSHSVEPGSKTYETLFLPMLKQFSEAGQTIIRAPLFDPSNPFSPPVRWCKKRDGTWDYDYTAWDAHIRLLTNNAGMKGAILCEGLLPPGMKFFYFDEETGAWITITLRPEGPEYAHYLTPFLKDFSQHLKKKEWTKRLYFNFENPTDSALRCAETLITKYVPGTLTAVTNKVPNQLVLTGDRITLPLGKMNDSAYAQIVSGLSPAVLFLGLPSDPLRTACSLRSPSIWEWLPLYAEKNGFNGVRDLSQSEKDFWIYPGNRSSVRFERLRDGLESRVKIDLLNAQIAQQPTPEAQKAAKKLNEALAAMRWEGWESKEYANTLARINDALSDLSRTVPPSSNPKTFDPKMKK